MIAPPTATGQLVARARNFLDRLVRRLRYEHAATKAALRGRSKAHARLRGAFASFELCSGTRAHAMRSLAARAEQLRTLARVARAGDDAFFRALVEAADHAASIFRPATLQSYVDVTVRVAALRAFAEYAVSRKTFDGDAANIFAALVGYAPEDRAALLAHSELLLDRGRAAEAIPLLQRALRMQAVCQTAQQLLARAGNGDVYDLRDRFCPLPFTHLSTSFKGDAFACCCAAWVPYPIGNVIDAPSADAVWNSEVAIEVRRSIHDGDFRYCSRTLCSYLAARSLPKKSEIADPALRRIIDERRLVIDDAPAMVQLNHDPSCNLACPSCRPEIVTAGPAEQRTYVDAAERVLLPLLSGMDGMVYISGGGEAFASAHYRKILSSLNRRDYPGLYVFLITNGQLLDERRWAEFSELPEMIGNLSVSVDAACAPTYERLRRPGRWDVLMENLEVMSRMRREGTIRRLQINFVVQADNFRELPDFIALGNRLGVDNFWLQRLTNYGSFAETAFARADVTSPLHPDHEELLSILRRPILADRRVDMDMLRPLLPEHVQAAATNPWLTVRTRAEMTDLDNRDDLRAPDVAVSGR